MTYRVRSPYAALPVLDLGDTFRHREILRDAFERHGLDGLRLVLGDVLRPLVESRAGHPAEVALLREWHAEAVEEALVFWRERLARPKAREHVAEEHAEESPQEPASAPPEVLSCSSCDSLFERPAGARGRPRSRCWTCSPARS